MNTTQQGVITLLKSAVLQKPLQLPADFDLEQAAYQVKKHHMSALLYEGATLCGISQELPIMQHLMQNCCKAILLSERQVRLTKQICDVFEENGIDYMLLKGCRMKPLYPKPELRMMGDIDILVRMEQYDRIRSLMEGLGMYEGSVTDHELHWHKKNLMVELHSKLIPSYNKDFFAYFCDGWFLAQKGQGTRYCMAPEDELVYLFTHFAKHYRDGGVGCRYVLDLWVFLRNNPNMDQEKIKRELDKLQLREFYENICHVIDVWYEGAPGDEKTDFITDYIFDSGSWGSGESRTTSIAVRDQANQKGSFRAKAVYFMRHAFPRVNILQEKYTLLKRAPWLLPLVWVYRPFYKLLCKKERSSVGRHRENLRNINPKNLQTRHEALQYVGLDYNF
jgi:hypothetical protein